MFNRPTSMAEALINAVVKTPKREKNWIARTVIDRAEHTNRGVTKEKDHFNVSYRTAKQVGLV